MKPISSCYVKGTVTFTTSFFMLLFAATKTNAQWIELGGANSSSFNGGINSIATDAGGNVYAGGGFTDINGHYYVAKWNGTAWNELGGANGSFNSFINAITTDAGGNVYAAGRFSDAEGHAYVAKWNGTAWSELGGANGAFNGFINTIATDAGGSIYAGGFFTDANGRYYVAKWNGTAWSVLGGENGAFNNVINTVASDAAGNVYAGGNFGDPNVYVAKWNGTVWSKLGGTNGSFNDGEIYSIATDTGGNVYAGGDFLDANGYSYVAKWNGTAWSELGGGGSTFSNNGFVAYIYSIATDAGGNVYAGGGIADSNDNFYVAKWNGTAWGELGGANSFVFNHGVLSIATDSVRNVYAGGDSYDFNGEYYVAEYAQNILPVTLISITATKVKTGVAINWQTATETNSSHFNVQRSTNGNSFANIGTLKALGSGANEYEFIDNDPANGVNYYRLQNVDKDGSYTYSPIRTMNEAMSFSVSIYPNPVHNDLSLNFDSDKAKTVQLQIVSNEGKVITTQKIHVAAGISMQNINTTSLSNGEYYVRLVSEDGQTKLKFVKER